ncbi:hypothetical protein [Hymenobacter guriensis]|uniref:Uncharacterized protein n=1 Tax=Hymenobacter guriensis TaxID=2793065 RepID=A0ABS0KWS5_9BACT|nr:hypothetical protein [Hymenobacter guriensis]MBG8552323.1 hypothetical protein [Hymenobacter guriensis]
MYFPADTLITSLNPLLDAAGLQRLTLQTEYCQLYGWHFTAHAFRGAAAVLLIDPCAAVATPEQLHEQLTDALLDQLAAACTACGQL